jgi:hypothetical protein
MFFAHSSFLKKIAATFSPCYPGLHPLKGTPMMKFLMMLTAALLFTACAHKGHKNCGGEGHKCEKDQNCGKCDGEKKESCPECAASEAATAAPAWNLNGITKEQFQAAYNKEKTKLNKNCVKAATEYCGKTTKDLQITETEAMCLWEKSNRVTREVLPQLDKTKCDKTLKKMTAGHK